MGGVALEQAIPLGRVWSFPKEIKCVNAPAVISATIEQYADYATCSNLFPGLHTYYSKLSLDSLRDNFAFMKTINVMPTVSDPTETPRTISVYRYST